MKKPVYTPDALARVIVTSADASQDYYITRGTARELGLLQVMVYDNGEYCVHDPKRVSLKHKV